MRVGITARTALTLMAPDYPLGFRSFFYWPGQCCPFAPAGGEPDGHQPGLDHHPGFGSRLPLPPPENAGPGGHAPGGHPGGAPCPGAAAPGNDGGLGGFPQNRPHRHPAPGRLHPAPGDPEPHRPPGPAHELRPRLLRDRRRESGGRVPVSTSPGCRPPCWEPLSAPSPPRWWCP